MPGMLYAYIIDEMDRTNTEKSASFATQIALFYFPVSGIIKALETKKLVDFGLNFVALNKTIFDAVRGSDNGERQLNSLFGEKFMDWYKKNNDYLDYAFILKDAYGKEWKNAAIGFVSEWDEFSENQKKKIEKQIPGISAAIRQLKIR